MLKLASGNFPRLGSVLVLALLACLQREQHQPQMWQVRPGGIDSYYEYLWKCWRLFGDKGCLAMWQSIATTIDAMP